MCAIEAGKRGRSVLVIDHAKAPGEKIRISGGGRCNYHQHRRDDPQLPVGQSDSSPCRPCAAIGPRISSPWSSATASPTTRRPWASCSRDGSAKQIITMLLTEMKAAGVQLRLETSVEKVARTEGGFEVSLVVREGRLRRAGRGQRRQVDPEDGRDGPGLRHRQAVRSEHRRNPAGAGPPDLRAQHAGAPDPALSGVALDAVVAHGRTRFQEGMLFTHRGLSGPSILQISSYWREGDEIRVDMAPGVDALAALKAARTATPRQAVATALSTLLPKRVAQVIADEEAAGKGNIAELFGQGAGPGGGRGQRLDLQARGLGRLSHRRGDPGRGRHRRLDSRTLEAKAVPGLYFIGEVVDVTGWLGGYNFQWAWASGWCAGQAV
ncbi:NAD(P)/FAD-dependent oxidoreductase [Caulobacter segnis]